MRLGNDEAQRNSQGRRTAPYKNTTKSKTGLTRDSDARRRTSRWVIRLVGEGQGRACVLVGRKVCGGVRVSRTLATAKTERKEGGEKEEGGKAKQAASEMQKEKKHSQGSCCWEAAQLTKLPGRQEMRKERARGYGRMTKADFRQRG